MGYSLYSLAPIRRGEAFFGLATAAIIAASHSGGNTNDTSPTPRMTFAPAHLRDVAIKPGIQQSNATPAKSKKMVGPTPMVSYPGWSILPSPPPLIHSASLSIGFPSDWGHPHG